MTIAEKLKSLPTSAGIYIHKNAAGKIIYVGKAKNIRTRVNSHFSNNSQSRQKQNFLRHVYSISFKECATDLMACILESTEIKKLWPIFNYSQKRWEDTYGIFVYEDRNGYQRLAIEKNKKQLPAVCTFHYLTDGHTILRKLIRDFNLCPKLCFIQPDHADCEGIKEAICYGACQQKEEPAKYNKRVEEAIQSLKDQPSFAIIENGLNDEEQSCVLVWKGQFYGMGYIPNDTQLTEPEDLKELLTSYKENLFIRNLVNGYAAKYPNRVKSFQPVAANS